MEGVGFFVDGVGVTATDGDGVSAGPTIGAGVVGLMMTGFLVRRIVGSGVVTGPEVGGLLVGFLVSSDFLKVLFAVGLLVMTGSPSVGSAVTGQSDRALVDSGDSVGLLVLASTVGSVVTGREDGGGVGLVVLTALFVGSAVGADDGMTGQNPRDAGVVSSCVTLRVTSSPMYRERKVTGHDIVSK
jgi:hypothetical protein